MGLLNLNKKKGSTLTASAVQTSANARHPYHQLSSYMPMNSKSKIYLELRYAVPIIDAAINKIVRLTEGFHFETGSESLNSQMNSYFDDINVGGNQQGISAFISNYLNQLLTFGTAIGEMVLGENGIYALYNSELDAIELKRNENGIDVDFYNFNYKISNPQLILYSVLNPKPRDLCGTSMLEGLPFISDVLMKIYNTIGQNWEHAGNVRYAVICKPTGDSIDSADAEKRAGAAATAVSLSSGDDYNVSENSITVMVNAPVGVTSVTNEKPFEGGCSEERDTPYRNRILRHYGILPNGINCTSCENQVMTLDYVTDCRIVPSTNNSSMIIYVATKSNTLSENQKSEIAEKIMIIDAAKVSYSIVLSKTSRYKLNVDAEIMTGFDGEKIKKEIINRLFEVSSGARIGEHIYLSRFRKALNDIEGLIDVSFRSDKIKADAVMVAANATLLLSNVEVNFINE